MPLQILLYKDSNSTEDVARHVKKAAQLFRSCGVNFGDSVEIRIFTTPGLPDTFTLHFEPEDFVWEKLKRLYSIRGLPVIYLASNSRFRALEGQSFDARRNHPPEGGTVNLVAEFFAYFSPFGIYMTNLNRPGQPRSSENTKLTTLAHELGHILFKEGHADSRRNIMYTQNLEYEGDAGRLRREITAAQCSKARTFVREYESLVSEFVLKGAGNSLTPGR